MSARARHARALFAPLGPTYDRVGAVLSFGQDPRWRRFLVSRLPYGGGRVLDVATGSGNAALAAARLGSDVTGIDYVPALLDRARERAAAERLDVRLAEADAHSLPFGDGEFDVLATLRRAGAPYELSAGELAATSMVTSGAITKRVDRLEAAGRVERTVCADDARSRRIRLTPAGLALVDDAVERHVANEHRLLAGLTAAERRELAGLLEKWGRTLEDQGT